MVVIEGRNRNVWKGGWSTESLDLHLTSCGAACAMVHTWLLELRTTVFGGQKPPPILRFASFPLFRLLLSLIGLMRIKVLIITFLQYINWMGQA